MATGGSIEEITLAGRVFAVAADADITISRGNDSNETQMNGNNTGRKIKTPMPWKLAGIVAAVDHTTDDAEFLQNLADGEDFAVSITLADDTVLNATGGIEGELTFSSQNTTALFDLSGPASLTK